MLVEHNKLDQLLSASTGHWNKNELSGGFFVARPLLLQELCLSVSVATGLFICNTVVSSHPRWVASVLIVRQKISAKRAEQSFCSKLCWH